MNFAYQNVVGIPATRADQLAPAIFHESWWLDLVTGGRIETRESIENGRVVGRMFFVRDRRAGFRSSNMPPLTHFLGPAVDPGQGDPQTRHAREMSITNDLIRQLPAMSSFRQKMHRGIQHVLPFQNAGFETSVQFTYEIAPDDTGTAWAAMRDKTRNCVRSGRNKFSISSAGLDPEIFAGFYVSNIRKRSLTENLDQSLCATLIRECVARNRGKIWAAYDSARNLKAAIFCVWDAKVCYYLMSTRAQDSGNNAVPPLIWEAVSWAISSGRVFDFDGIADLGSAHFYSGFGGKIAPRFIVSRSTLPYKILRQVRRITTGGFNPYC